MQWYNPKLAKPIDKQSVWYVLDGKVRHGIYREAIRMWSDCEESCWHGSTEVEAWTPLTIPELPRPEEIS
jgi:hypothetical protein